MPINVSVYDDGSISGLPVAWYGIHIELTASNKASRVSVDAGMSSGKVAKVFNNNHAKARTRL